MSRLAEEEKCTGAMRIFEALSGVDEELLENSEYAKAGFKQPKVIAFWRYGKALVACVCVLLLGGLLLTMPKMSKKQWKEADCAAPESIMGNAGDTEMSGATEKAEVFEEVAMDTAANKVQNEESATTEGSGSVQDAAIEVDTQDGLKESTSTGCPRDFRIELGETEARAAEVLGVYIPSKLPAGYRFESASAVEGDNDGAFSEMLVIWTRGLDDIWWKVSRVNASEVVCADIADTEKYDVHLYDIPYADTVPEEYREVFDRPVFRACDVSLEVIERRMKTIRDAGDTDTPRGNFAILFEEGIMVQFNGRATAKEVWDMLLLLPTAGSTAG